MAWSVDFNSGNGDSDSATVSTDTMRGPAYGGTICEPPDYFENSQKRIFYKPSQLGGDGQRLPGGVEDSNDANATASFTISYTYIDFYLLNKTIPWQKFTPSVLVAPGALDTSFSDADSPRRSTFVFATTEDVEIVAAKDKSHSKGSEDVECDETVELSTCCGSNIAVSAFHLAAGDDKKFRRISERKEGEVHSPDKCNQTTRVSRHDIFFVRSCLAPVEGGDNHVAPTFLPWLHELAKRKGVLMIFVEVQMCVGATVKFWALEHWGLPSPPGMVSFSKKAQAAGCSFRDAGLRFDRPDRQFNTRTGDSVRPLLFKAIHGEIEKHGLVEHTARVGGNMKGLGTLIAWDCPRREVLALAREVDGG
ncbi:4-aminobutyrate aminotransferase [Colletotrichum orchidophilum]|uniref:4-aminobutyrate aminotransferase n=1 Tax=Colletotrichum orchidophilum TaxID=1209926 RepID=A0A1G4B920_9PEZI|nr:4-aminobutyrate aminotransferase [Colletotrichum orchidophilum]OHE97901.1 4-aminobutyrate aminotransferase [Colletotrichum orchidophilum]